MTNTSKPKLFNIGTPRTSEYKPDGTLNLEAPIGNEYDEVLDPLNDLLTGRNRSLPASRHGTAADADPIQTARERQRVERELVVLQQNMRAVIADKLAPQRILIEAVIHDSKYNFTVFAVNRGDGCRLTTQVSIDDALGACEIVGRDPLLAICDTIAQKILAARDRMRD